MRELTHFSIGEFPHFCIGELTYGCLAVGFV